MNQMKYKLSSIITALALTLGLIRSVNASSDFAPEHAGISYYVAVNGNDLNACTQSAPCKSFNKAMSLMQSGDILYVTAGTYNQELIITKSGLTVIGQNAVIDTTAHTAIHVKSTAQNVVVRGFTVTRTRSHAIWIEGKFVTIEGNAVYHSILENGTLSNGVITCGNGQRGSAIKVNSPGSDVVIRGNTVYENCGEGIAATIANNVVIENNNVRDNKGVNIYIDNSYFIQVRNNNSYCTKPNDKPSGIALGEEQYAGWGSQLRDVMVSGNTVTNCSFGIIAFQSNTGGTLRNVTFTQNFIPSGEVNGLSLDNHKNQNVLVSYNTYYDTPWIRNSAGVTLQNNIISSQQTTFADVPFSHGAHSYIEKVYNAGITAGCAENPRRYCPNSTVKRAEMAVFLLRAMYGGSYTPNAASGILFLDIPSSYWASAWIESFSQAGITSGCGGGSYCPENSVTRAQMAVFLLRSKYGSDYTPPPATGQMFSDVPANHSFAAWIEQFANEGISSGCGSGRFCPDTPVTRAQMAIFLSIAFDLP